MSSVKKISVIMPAYNAEKTLERAVSSVLHQTYPEWELILVNDASGDGTQAMLEQYAAADPRIRIFINAQNRGVSFTRHRAVEQATGDWIAFLDSDDAWAPEKLEKQVALLAEKQAKLVFTGSTFMDAAGAPIDWMLHVPETIGYRKLLKQNLISNSSVLVEKNTYLRYEMAGDAMHEDFACWLQMLRAGVCAYGIDEPLLIYRLSATSKSGNKWKAARMNWNTYRAIGLPVVTAAYYMVWYTINGVRKYKNLKK